MHAFIIGNFGRFLWAGKGHRLNQRLLTQPKLHKYLRASHMAWILTWCSPELGKQWFHLEQSFSECLLGGLPWLNCAVLCLLLTHQTIGATLTLMQSNNHLVIAVSLWFDPCYFPPGRFPRVPKMELSSLPLKTNCLGYVYSTTGLLVFIIRHLSYVRAFSPTVEGDATPPLHNPPLGKNNLHTLLHAIEMPLPL